MNAFVVYKDKSDHAREVIDYLREFGRRTGRTPKIIDPETREGSAFCQTYDIVEYPTIIATDTQGSMQNMWRGLPLPTINELSYYV